MICSMTFPDVEYPNCPNGCAANDRRLFVARDRLHGVPGTFGVVQCQACSLIRTAPRPTRQSIGMYYPDDYGPYSTSEIAEPAGPRSPLNRALRAVARRLIQFKTECVPKLPPGRMLEIGCAAGGFLARMASQGWSVEGIEFSDHAAAKARNKGFNVQSCSIEDAQPPVHPYDLVVGWMVIEHLHDPRAALEKLAEWTVDGGWLAISVPNANSLDFRLFRGAGYGLHVPAHMYHFTPRTITSLLSRSGWRVEKIYHQRVLGSLLGSIGFWLEDRGAPTRLSKFFIDLPDRPGYLSHVLYPLALLLSWFGQTGRMTIWARKT